MGEAGGDDRGAPRGRDPTALSQKSPPVPGQGQPPGRPRLWSRKAELTTAVTVRPSAGTALGAVSGPRLPSAGNQSLARHRRRSRASQPVPPKP